MSFGLTATLLLRLDARMGQWTPVTELASHCAVSDETVVNELEAMFLEGMVQVERHILHGTIVRARCSASETLLTDAIASYLRTQPAQPVRTAVLAEACGVTKVAVIDALEHLAAAGRVTVGREYRSGVIETAAANPRYGT